jgi:SPP1 gp7 family putative phage head morphogenesis protein
MNNDKFQKAKQKALDKVYETQSKKMIKQLQKEYDKAYKDIKLEILDWYAKMDEIQASNPNFAFSRLKYIEDLQKQFELILEELAEVEKKIIEDGMKQTYVSDYIDLDKLNKKYFDMSLNSPLPQFNQLNSASMMEAWIKLPQATTRTMEIAKQLDLSFFYDGTAGRWFNARIDERCKKLGYKLSETIRAEVIKGTSVGQISGKIAKDLDITFNHAKAMVRTELATVENTAVVHNCYKLGYNGLKFSTYHDDTVCPICKSMDGKIFPVESVKGSDMVMHVNCRCTLVEVVLDENGKEVKSSFRDEAEEYLKKKAEQRKAEADKVKAEYLAKKQAEKEEAKKTKKFRR